MPGSIIVGAIRLDDEAETFDIATNGLSIAYSFDPTNGPPDFLESNRAPFVIVDNRAAVVDPTLEAFQDDILADLTNGIFGGVSARLDGLSGGTVVGVTRHATGSTTHFKGAVVTAANEPQAWAHSFGGTRHQDASRPIVDADLQFGGIMSGFDRQIAATTRLGVLLGGSQGEADTAFDSQEEDINTFFAGLYGRHERGRFTFDATVLVGHSAHERERRVLNNLVATGFQTASADFDAIFVAAALEVAADVPLGTHYIRPSAHLRYAGSFLDGFTETGAADTLTIADREVHLLQGRAQLALPTRAGDQTRRCPCAVRSKWA